MLPVFVSEEGRGFVSPLSDRRKTLAYAVSQLRSSAHELVFFRISSPLCAYSDKRFFLSYVIYI